ncbi:MAG: flagellar hook-basal body complex protein FliE [Deltaproteobacteria bacterium]|nr:flagellar hook-basal body complex protein FliE [Deltaproteobacteria bacterium]
MRSLTNVSPEQSQGLGRIDRSLDHASGQTVSGSGFAETLGGALQKVDQMQTAADVQAEKVAMGGGNLHEMSLALEKADVSMRLAMKVRNKLVEAYQEIMRMSV